MHFIRMAIFCYKNINLLQLNYSQKITLVVGRTVTGLSLLEVNFEENIPT